MTTWMIYAAAAFFTWMLLATRRRPSYGDTKWTIWDASMDIVGGLLFPLVGLVALAGGFDRKEELGEQLQSSPCWPSNDPGHGN